MLHLDDVVLRYGGRAVLDGVDLRLKEGTATAIMGPSGSGKTSLLHCIAGIIQPDFGTIHVDGTNISSMSASGRSSPSPRYQ